MSTSDRATNARDLFRYLTSPEWSDYRVILSAFADTFFADFNPEEIHGRLSGTPMTVETVRDRLESLREWGNLTETASVGSPASIEDYYRRRTQYLMTRPGQEVHEFVERLLVGSDEITDMQPGRLRDLLRPLRMLADHAQTGFEQMQSEDAATAVRNVFDTHEQFTREMTGFFRQLAHWQSRYDLDESEVHMLATVLVGYVGEKLTEIERLGPHIGRLLERILPQLETLVGSLDVGLASRFENAGLTADVAVQRLRGADRRDWEYLANWYADSPGRRSRLSEHTRQALAAVRTLTANVSRLSRLGTATTSRRSDFLRLAGFFDAAPSAGAAHDIATAALGLAACRHSTTLSSDADDPDPVSTPWHDAARATVPVALRERGDTGARGQTTPMRDRRNEQRHLRERRQRERVAREVAASELLFCADTTGRIDRCTLSPAAFGLLRDLIGLAGPRSGSTAGGRSATDAGICLTLRRDRGEVTTIGCPFGDLTMQDATVMVTAVVPVDDHALPASFTAENP